VDHSVETRLEVARKLCFTVQDQRLNYALVI